MDEFVVRSLTREYRIRTASPEVAPLLAFLSASPEIEGLSLEPVGVSLEATDDGFTLVLPAQDFREGSAAEIVGRLCEVIFRGYNEEAPGAPLLHGASLVADGRRILLIGTSGAGKSTLALHLLSRGFDFETDENVVVGEDCLVARPRRLHIKPPSVPLVPALAEAVLRSPFVHEPSGELVYAVDPSAIGRPWRIGRGKADHIVILRRNHGGNSGLAPLEKLAAFQELAAECLLPETRRAAALARLHRVASEADTWKLEYGDLDEAEYWLRGLLQNRNDAS